MAEHELRWRDRLGTRLAVAFTATAMAAVAAVTAVALTATSSGVRELAAEQRARAVDDVVTALEGAYLTAGGWEGADLLAAHTLAAAAGAVLIVATPELGELPVPPDLSGTRRQLRDHGDRSREDRVVPGPSADHPDDDTSVEVDTSDDPEVDATAPDPGVDSPTAPDDGSGSGERAGPGPSQRGDGPTGGSGSGTTEGAPDTTRKTPIGSPSGQPSALVVDLTLVSAAGRA
jgi:hypothetical protein